MGALVVIPARYESTRLPGKVLLPVGDYPLVWHTWAAAVHWAGAVDVVVATGDEIVQEQMTRLGVPVVPTWRQHASGTSRACEAAGRHDWEGGWVVNLQADHPRITHSLLDSVLAKLREYPQDRAVVATVAAPLHAWQVGDRNRVKAIVDSKGEARWFTRSPLKYAWHHVGVYAWHRAACRHLLHMPRCQAALDEGLEQLDWLHAGWTVAVALVRQAGDGIDSLGDLGKFQRELSADAPTDA